MLPSRMSLCLGLAATIVAASAGPAAAAPVARKPVTMTLSAPDGLITAGGSVVVTGRAANGTTGNAAAVDLSFATRGTSNYERVASVRAAANGTFTATLVAHSSGTFEAEYHGNTQRKAATAYDTITVTSALPVAVTFGPSGSNHAEMINGNTITDGYTAPRAGTQVTLRGRAANGPTGNRAIVDFYRSAPLDDDPAQVYIGSTTADDDGTFALAVTSVDAFTSYQASYRGNRVRRPAAVSAVVDGWDYTITSDPQAILVVSGRGAWTSPDFTKAAGPLWIDATTSGCYNQPHSAGLDLAFTDGSPRQSGTNWSHGPGWLIRSGYGGPPLQHIDLAPDIDTGHITISGCRWTLRVYQDPATSH